MSSLFILLGMLVCYLVIKARRIFDKVTTNSSLSKYYKYLNLWEQEVADPDMEAELDKEIEGRFMQDVIETGRYGHASRGAIYNEVIAVVRSLPSWSNTENIILYWVDNGCYSHLKKIARDIMLAKRGKISQWDLQFPCKLPTDVRNQHRELLLWIERELNKNGAEVELFVEVIKNLDDIYKHNKTRLPGSVLQDSSFSDRGTIITGYGWRSKKYKYATFSNCS